VITGDFAKRIAAEFSEEGGRGAARIDLGA
jgi:hypothetical protein